MGNPTWRYRRVGDKIESRIFDSDNLPEGWEDSPAKCVAKKLGRPKKVTHDDG